MKKHGSRSCSASSGKLRGFRPLLPLLFLPPLLLSKGQLWVVVKKPRNEWALPLPYSKLKKGETGLSLWEEQWPREGCMRCHSPELLTRTCHYSKGKLGRIWDALILLRAVLGVVSASTALVPHSAGWILFQELRVWRFALMMLRSQAWP